MTEKVSNGFIEQFHSLHHQKMSPSCEALDFKNYLAMVRNLAMEALCLFRPPTHALTRSHILLFNTRTHTHTFRNTHTYPQKSPLFTQFWLRRKFLSLEFSNTLGQKFEAQFKVSLGDCCRSTDSTSYRMTPLVHSTLSVGRY